MHWLRALGATQRILEVTVRARRNLPVVEPGHVGLQWRSSRWPLPSAVFSAGNHSIFEDLPGQPWSRASRRAAGSWARAGGEKPKAVVVHPRLPGDKEDLLSWDVEEAIALSRALGWRVVTVTSNDESSDEDESDNSGTDSEEESGVSNDEAVEVSARDRSVLVSDEHIVRMDRVDQRFFFLVPDLSRIAVRVALTRADILFVNAVLTPSQQRSLEAAMDLVTTATRSTGGPKLISVFDRSRLILSIFARRAVTPLAKLRVELAEAQEAKGKLGSAAVHGVAGQLRRVGEALARRVRGCDRNAMISRTDSARGVSSSFNSSSQNTRQKQQRVVIDKEKRIKDELARLQQHRGAQRKNRSKLETIALVGYTNVGKSAIVNRLTGSDLLVRDGVFVTLDVAARRVPLPSGADCYILDSVGFVKDLPVDLCEPFQATVEELASAHLVLHVRDLSHPSRDEHTEIIKDVLKKAGVDVDRRVVEVWNKVDLLSKKELKHFLYIQHRRVGTNTPVCCVSALHGDGFDQLLQCIDGLLTSLAKKEVAGEVESKRLILPRQLQRIQIAEGLPSEEVANIWTFLREECSIVEDSISAAGDTVTLDAWMDAAVRSRFIQFFGDDLFA